MSPTDLEPLDPADAVARLLQAEAVAREAVQRCEQEVAREAQAAREAARGQLARAERRIEAAAQRGRERLEHAVAALRAQARALDAPGAADDPRTAHLDAALARLAARLTTADDDAGR